MSIRSKRKESSAASDVYKGQDYFHADNMEGVTSRSGHSLDVDGRFSKMIEAGMFIIRRMIDSALAHHKNVTVINVIGNHDDTSSQWLSVALQAMYEDEPRVTVQPTTTPCNSHAFCKNLQVYHSYLIHI